MDNHHTEREAFEAWGNETFNYGFKPESWGERDPGEYAHEGTQMAYEGYLAGRSQQPATAVPAGWRPMLQETLTKCRALAMSLPEDGLGVLIAQIDVGLALLASPPAQAASPELRAAAEQALSALETYVTTYNDYWERGMDILEPIGDAALAKLRAALTAPSGQDAAKAD